MKITPQHLCKYINKSVIQLCFVVYRFVKEEEYLINSIGIQFDMGKHFLFGCSGSGEISIIEDKCETYDINEVMESRIIRYPPLENSILEDLTFDYSALSLHLSKGIINIINKYDELIVEVNGYRVSTNDLVAYKS